MNGGMSDSYLDALLTVQVWMMIPILFYAIMNTPNF